MLARITRLLRRQSRPRPTPIRTLEVGQIACVEGIALAMGEPIPAPFSGPPCATLTVLQEELNARSGDIGWWPYREFLPLAEIDCDQRFWLVDDEGMRASIHRGGWSTLRGFQRHWPAGPSPARKERLERFRDRLRGSPGLAALENVGLERREWSFRATELVVPQGQRVAVTGRVRESKSSVRDSETANYRSSSSACGPSEVDCQTNEGEAGCRSNCAPIPSCQEIPPSCQTDRPTCDECGSSFTSCGCDPSTPVSFDRWADGFFDCVCAQRRDVASRATAPASRAPAFRRGTRSLEGPHAGYSAVSFTWATEFARTSSLVFLSGRPRTSTFSAHRNVQDSALGGRPGARATIEAPSFVADGCSAPRRGPGFAPPGNEAPPLWTS